MSTFRNINIPTGGSYRINNVPLPVIDDSASSALSMYSSNQIVILNTAQNLLITTLTNTVNQLVIDVNLLKNPITAPYAKLATTHALGTSVVAAGCSANGVIIIVGGNTNIVKMSANSGVSWTSVSIFISSINKICVSDSGQYIILGGSGGLSFSTNYGVSFTMYNTNPHAVCQNSTGTISISGLTNTNGLLYRATTTNASSFSSIVGSYTQRWQAICVSDNGNIIVAALVNDNQAYAGYVYFSQTAGATWGRSSGIDDVSRYWSHFHCSAGGTNITLYQAGAGGDVWQSSDSGSSFTKKNITGSWLNGEMSSNGVKRVGTLSTNIKISEDSGATWVDGTYSAPTPAGGTWDASTISSDGTKTYMFYSNGDTYAN